jgi:cell division protein FtsB
MSALINQSRNRVPRIAEAAVERARLTVVPRRRQRAARLPFVVLVSVLLVGGVAGLLTFNTSMQQASFTATNLQERAQALDARQQSLKMQVQTLNDPQHLAEKAKALGMVPPSAPAFLRLSNGRIVGHPAPASSADAFPIDPAATAKPKAFDPAPVIKHVAAKHQQGTTTGAATAGAGGATGTNGGHTQQSTDQQAGGSTR